MAKTSAPTVKATHLRPTKSGYFLRKVTPLTNVIITDVFAKTIAATGAKRVGTPVIRKAIAAAKINVVYSLLVFRTKVEPAFLEATSVKDVVHGYLLVCELPQTVAVFAHRAQFDDSLLGAAVIPLPHDELTRLFADQATAYEKLSLKMMSVSQRALRGRSYEAADLRYAMPTLGSNRSIPRHIRLKKGISVHSLTPGTFRQLGFCTRSGWTGPPNVCRSRTCGADQWRRSWATTA